MIVTNSLVIVSDLHCGCQMGLVRPDGGHTDGGGRYEASPFQRWLWRCWRYFMDEWVPMATQGDDYALVVNGDALDGRHHRATTQWSQNLADQRKEAGAIIGREVDNPSCAAYYHIRGTEAHVGPSAEDEETLAKGLGAVPDEAGNFARYELWKWVGPERQGLCHVMHHIGTTGSQAYETTAVHKEFIEALTEAGRWGERPPDVVIRSHRHRLTRTEVATKRGRGVSIVTPGWQGKTPFAFRIAGARQSQPQFGGIMVRLSDEGELYVRHWVKDLERPEAE